MGYAGTTGRRAGWGTGGHISSKHGKKETDLFYMTTKRAIKVVTQIILDNQEDGELEGILNRRRIAALNRLVRIAEPKLKRRTKSTKQTLA